MRPFIMAIAAFVSASAAVTIDSAPLAQAGAITTHPDFNGDGYADLAVAAQFENNGRGVVHVLYGSASGPSGAGSIVFGQDTAGVPGAAGPNEFFGGMLAFGNFNGDAYDDLAVSTFFDKIGKKVDAGSVTVFRGSASGLLMNAEMFTDAFGTAGDDRVITGDSFGLALAAGDYDGDGDDDLAIGVPFDDSFIRFDPSGVGKVKILRSQGGSFAEAEVWRLKRGALPSNVRSGHFSVAFGYSLATLHGSAAADGLAVGIPGYGTTAGQLGAAAVFQGRPTSFRFRHFFPGLIAGDHLSGLTLAAGDMNNDDEADLIIGSPAERNDSGGIQVALLTAVRAPARAPWLFSQATSGFSAVNNPGDRFGSSMVVVDAGTDAYLYIGAPGDDLAHRMNSGGVYVLVGHPSGRPVAARANPVQSPQPTVFGSFGLQLTALDTEADGGDDVVISADGETVGVHRFAGAAYFYDSPDGSPVFSGSARFTQDTPGVPDRAEDDDQFGSTLAFR